tara:strand:- start:2311 stop:2505 length:195 start_codon:yes stop_codon:yes gene_type:complete
MNAKGKCFDVVLFVEFIIFFERVDDNQYKVIAWKLVMGDMEARLFRAKLSSLQRFYRIIAKIAI